MNTEFKKAIKVYLDGLASRDALFSARYALQGKSLDECCRYIVSEARKRQSCNCAVVDDATVYGWAVHYYQEDEVKIDKSATARVATLCEAKKPAQKKPVEAVNGIGSFDGLHKQLTLF